MKHILSFAFLMAFAFSAAAQFILGGQFGLNTTQNKIHTGSTSTETNKSSTLTILPRVAYGFGNTWAGLDVGFEYSHSVSPNFPGGNDITNTSLFEVAPFVRFIKKPADNIGLWAEAQINAAFGGAEVNGRQTSKVAQFGAGIRPGVIFFMGDHLSFEASFGRFGFLSTRNTDPDNSDNYSTNNNFGLSLNGTFLFGVNWAFSE